MRWSRLALVAGLVAAGLWWSSRPATACSCGMPLREPALVFEGVATSGIPARHGTEDWTFEVLERGRGAARNPMVVRVSASDNASCGLTQGPIRGQRYRVETDLGARGYPPRINLCAGELLPLASGEAAFPTVNDGEGAAGRSAMLGAAGALASLLALALVMRRAA